jgi:hypothetical protein
MNQRYVLTDHAQKRMQQRHITPHILTQVMRYGRIIHARGVTYRVIGRKEVSLYAGAGIDLRAAEGVQVLLATDGAVITTFRNHDLRKIRPSKRRHAHYH